MLNEASGKYPELDRIAKQLASKVTKMISDETRNVNSKMPYKAQYVLEELIKHLEDAV